MIQLPRRSVTRFFIPLIDVMTLLFCIFLLLPMVKNPGEGAADATARAGTPNRPAMSGQNLTDQERAELEHIRREKAQELQKRLAIRVLEIKAENGKLYYYDPQGGETEVANEADARDLIRRHQQELADRQKKDGISREPYYLFLFPRKLTGFPEEQQVRRYEGWFADVAHGTDNPRGQSE